MKALTPENLGSQVAEIAKILPPFPKVVMQVLDLASTEDVSLDVLIGFARNDPVILSGILATSNRLRRINAQTDIHDPFIAASLIGINQVRRIVVTAAMNKFSEEEKGAQFLLNHSRAVAIVAQELAGLCGVSSEKAYVAGILHDVGQLCFLIMDPVAFQEVYRQSAIDGSLLEREAATFGVDHAQIGGKLAEHWSLPEDFVSAILTHHDDSVVTSKLQAVVNIAESLTRALDIPQSQKNRLTKLNARAVAALEISWDSQAMLDCFGRCRARFCQSMG
jgi:putative nucleotidyltransferase with HDIG domain